MKKLFTLLVALVLIAGAFLPRQAGAQSPEKMSYQAVVRNSSDQLVTDHAVGMKISILKGSASGSAVYVETQTPTTNANGLVTLAIGGGTVISGSFSSIDWSDGPYFLKTETDPAGGANYAITGTSQLLSVPYALYAKTAENGFSSHYIGENYGGGIVFYVYDNGQHGLISATTNQSTSIRWYGGSNTNTRARADGVGAGKANTAILIANQGPVDGDAFAATICNEYSVTIGSITYGDWYLPSKFELNLLYLQKDVVGGFVTTSYWSSSESDSDLAWAVHFETGIQFNSYKNLTRYVRAIRAF